MMEVRKAAVSMERCEWDREPDEAGLERAAAFGFPAAEQAYQSLIGRGSVLSMVNLGSQYEFRPKENGGPDLMLAEYWYKKSIDAGSAVATLPVGYFYLRQKDYEEAFRVFAVGAERGYAPSMLRLAHLYATGLGVEKNEAKTDEWLLRAARLGNVWAKISRAERYMNTEGNYLKVAKGLWLLCIAAIQFRVERRLRPWSERLKK